MTPRTEVLDDLLCPADNDQTELRSALRATNKHSVSDVPEALFDDITTCVSIRAVSPWTILLIALGVAIFFEGLPWFVSPKATRRALEGLARSNDGVLRVIGVALMSAGLALAYLSLH